MLGHSLIQHPALRTLVFFLVFAVSAVSVSAQVPTAVPYQGLILDAGGAPVDQPVDLDFELFDALSSGNSLWTESHLGVDVVDGVYSVNLGSLTPLTQSILGNGSAFLEITVSGETLVPRQQLLSVPYALVAESVGSTSGLFLEQMVEHFPFDGQEPPNQHPDEGTGDADGDGTPNFVDPDNDNDGISDEEEVALGRPINVVNPTITTVSPNSIDSYASTNVTLSGQGLDTVSSVSFGSENPVPGLVTSTSFVVNVTAETTSTSESFIVTLGNGQSAVSVPVAITAVAPTIGKVAPPFATSGQATDLTITGTGFFEGMTVQVGSQTLATTVVSPTELTASMSSEPVGPLTVVLTHPNELTAEADYQSAPAGAKVVFVTSTLITGGFTAVSTADTICQLQANFSSLPGTYRAWLSESLASPSTQSPATTFPTTVGPYFRVDGTRVADDWSDLTDGTIQAPINVTSEGDGVNAIQVWTGTNADGTAGATGAETCDEWTSTAGTGKTGVTSLTNSGWTESAGNFGCVISARLYCFQQ